jgi:hypothetical protein
MQFLSHRLQNIRVRRKFDVMFDSHIDNNSSKEIYLVAVPNGSKSL